MPTVSEPRTLPARILPDTALWLLRAATALTP